jgi:hypothetical protein
MLHVREEFAAVAKVSKSAVDLGRVAIESRAAVFRDRPQPGGSIAMATAQNNTHNQRAVGCGSGNEQWIGSGTRVVDFRPLTQSDAIVLQGSAEGE